MQVTIMNRRNTVSISSYVAIGKQLGIFLLCLAAIKLGRAKTHA